MDCLILNRVLGIIASGHYVTLLLLAILQPLFASMSLTCLPGHRRTLGVVTILLIYGIQVLLGFLCGSQLDKALADFGGASWASWVMNGK